MLLELNKEPMVRVVKTCAWRGHGGNIETHMGHMHATRWHVTFSDGTCAYMLMGEVRVAEWTGMLFDAAARTLRR